MRFHLFQYPLPGTADLDDLNAFLAGHRVAAVQQHVVPTPAGAQLVFVVQTIEGAAAANAGGHRRAEQRSEGKIDYREVLSAPDFAQYSRLRDERRRIADQEGVPVYTVFSNAQLAEIVRRAVRTKAELLAIDGIGAARVERYGARILAQLAAAGSEPERLAPAAGQPATAAVDGEASA